MSDNYDDIAGFDTSSLGLGATALQGGQAGIDVANAAFTNLSGAARFANGVAVIEAAAADGTVSPVRALLAFADRLNQLDGDSSHFTAIGVEIAGLVASPWPRSDGGDGGLLCPPSRPSRSAATRRRAS